MADFEELLNRTSRTFGLAIPLLSEPTRRELTLAYLLFRLVDTVEDAEGKPRAERLERLAELEQLIAAPDIPRALAFARRCAKWRPTEHKGYLVLIDATPELVASLTQLPDRARDSILHHARRTVCGMMEFAGSGTFDGGLRLGTLDELRRYCYVVAGIVGELITDLFLHRWTELLPFSQALRADAPRFGEGLQLVNILKDADDDARSQRLFLPASVPRSAVFDLARDSLCHAERYTATLRTADADASAIAFTELPTRLAWQTLEQVERWGAGAKLGRDEVSRILRAVTARGGAAD